MGKVCCYITSGDDLYCTMTLTSAFMLRKHNPDIKIRVFVIDAEYTKIDYHASDLKLEVIHRPSISQNYFCLNRYYLWECEEKSVLHIDADTFIFDDVNEIFENYKDVDFAASLDDWITSTEWNPDLLSETYKILGSPEIPVFNTGIHLWNNGTVSGWCQEYLVEICERMMTDELPIRHWLDKHNRYHRETFSVCFNVSQRGLSYKVMDKKHVVNLTNEENWHAWHDKNYTIYHCFTQNWKRLAKSLREKKTFKPKLITYERI